MLSLIATCTWANPEITVDLPGGVSMDFVWIEPGVFSMGVTEQQKQQLDFFWRDDFNNMLPAHEVTISKGFYLGNTR